MADYSSFNLSNGSDPTKVSWTSVSNTFPMTYDPTTIVTQNVALEGDQGAVDTAEAYSDAKVPKTYVDGVQKTNQRLNWADNTTTSGGTATFYITSDRTSSGTARATAIDLDTVNPRTEDGTGQYAFGSITSPNVKTVLVPLFKQVFSGLTLLGVNVLGSVTNSAAPDGTVVRMNLNGDAA